jgi:putative aldouronate transport system permease protein
MKEKTINYQGTASLGRRISRNWELYLFLIPAIVYLFIFNYMPMYGVQIAFRNYVAKKGVFGSDWVGLKHFIRAFRLPNFMAIIRNTILLSLYSLAVSFPVPIVLALVINEIKSPFFKRSVQTISYAPHFISTVVLISMIDMFCNTDYGTINRIIQLFNGGTPVPLLADQRYFRSLYVLSGVWQTAGWSAIVYLSALSTIDPELHESAMIDGASRYQRILHINLPSIFPTISILFILQVGSLMSVGFEKVYLMQKPLNLDVSEIISTYVYKQGLQQAQYSFSAAIGLLNSIVNCMLLLITNLISRTLSGSSLF